MCAVRAGIGVHHRERDLSHAERLALSCPREDDVLHSSAAQAFRALFSQHPTDGVADVGFAAAIGSHNGRDAGAMEAEIAAVIERLEALNIDSSKLEHDKSFLTDSSEGGVFPSYTRAEAKVKTFHTGSWGKST